MAYQGLNLGDIVAQASQIKGAQQRQQLGDLALQQAQTDQAQTQGVNSLIASNPNASLADLARVGGMKGVAAAGDLGAARTQDSQFQLLQQLHGLQQQKFLTDQVAADPTKMPQVAQQLQGIGVQGHPDGWQHLPPDQIQANATKASQALDAQIKALTMQLVPPDKQAQMQNERDIAAGNNATSRANNADTIAGENTRDQFNQKNDNARAAATVATTRRGQDLEAARAGVPSGYERDPDNPSALRPIAGGPHDPNAIAQGLDSRSSVQFQRVVNAGNSAVESIKNISELPAGTNAGWFSGMTSGQPSSLFGAGKAVLGRELTSQASQSYQTMLAGVSRNLATLETSGLAPAGSLTHSMDALTMQPGDTGITQLRKMAEMRQIVVTNLEPQLSNPKLAAPQRQIIQNIVGAVQKAVPFTHSDITKLERSKNPDATIMDFAQQTGLPSAQSAGVTNNGRPDLASFQAQPGSSGTDSTQWDKRPDGSQKGSGWLGVLRRPDGGVSSEISVGVNIGGKETDIPLLVPSLTKSEVTTLLNSDPKDPSFFSKLPASIKQKAVSFARDRIAQGQSPFAAQNESPVSSQPIGSHPAAIQSLLDKYK